MNKVADYLGQKSTWTGGSSLLLIAGVFGVEDVLIQAVCGAAIAAINLFDVFRKEKK